jgi:aspartyl-tRNA(Asn)/glutamyl-tRNA(Gln) amidotransferase subunit A
MPHTRYGIPAYFVISRVEAASNLHRYDGVKYGYRTPERVSDLAEMYRKTRAQGFGLQPKLRILMGMYVSAAQYSEQYYNRALKVRTLIRQDFVQAFDPQGPYRLNALLTPTTPTAAFPMGAVYGDSVLMQYADQLTVPANHAGVPGLSIPAGFDQQGLPIGIQLLGPDFSEAMLLRIGRAYEIATQGDAWKQRFPKRYEEGYHEQRNRGHWQFEHRLNHENGSPASPGRDGNQCRFYADLWWERRQPSGWCRPRRR